jgi:hypothetical protein
MISKKKKNSMALLIRRNFEIILQINGVEILLNINVFYCSTTLGPIIKYKNTMKTDMNECPLQLNNKLVAFPYSQ